jgi:ribosomal protein S18 acetylase RimI-like enzyme
VQTEYLFEKLGATHDRSSFTCTAPSLERYPRQQARQEQDKRVAAVFVLTDSATHTLIVGYYTLSAASVAYTDLPQDITRRLPRYPYQPVILIGRLAVDTRFAGRGHGRRLLIDALARSFHTEIGAIAVVVDAIDAAAQQFYERFGFMLLPDRGNRLFLPMAAIVRLLGRSSV